MCYSNHVAEKFGQFFFLRKAGHDEMVGVGKGMKKRVAE